MKLVKIILLFLLVATHGMINTMDLCGRCGWNCYDGSAWSDRWSRCGLPGEGPCDMEHTCDHVQWKCDNSQCLSGPVINELTPPIEPCATKYTLEDGGKTVCDTKPASSYEYPAFAEGSYKQSCRDCAYFHSHPAKFGCFCWSQSQKKWVGAEIQLTPEGQATYKFKNNDGKLEFE